MSHFSGLVVLTEYFNHQSKRKALCGCSHKSVAEKCGSNQGLSTEITVNDHDQIELDTFYICN